MTKLFYITINLPSLFAGADIRNYYLIKQLAKDKKNQITIFSVTNNNTTTDVDILKNDLHVWIETFEQKKISYIASLYYSIVRGQIPFMVEQRNSGLEELLNQRISETKPDIIVISTLFAYSTIEKLIPFCKANKIKIIFDNHNVEQKVFHETLKSFSLIKKIIGYRILPGYIRLENKAVSNSDLLIVCSDKDKKFFQSKTSRIEIIPNGVDCDSITPTTLKHNQNIIFTGTWNYQPNIDGIRYFLERVFPLIRKNKPKVKLYVVGNKPPDWLKRVPTFDKCVIVTGFVKDVRQYLAISRVCICPIRIGSGTRLKILEYFAAQKPVVSTSKGAEGISCTNGKNIILADTPEIFADETINILNNDKKAITLGEQGRRLALSKYNWSNISKQFSLVIKSIQGGNENK